MNLVSGNIMSGADFIALLPIIVVGAGIVVVMLAAAFWRRTAAVLALALLTLVLAFLALPIAASVGPRQVTPLLIFDGYTLFYTGLMLAASFAVLLLCWGYFRRPGDESRGHEARGHEADSAGETVYILLLLGTLGSMVLVASSHFASFFLGLELLSVSLFALIAYPSVTERPLEGGIKYLVLAGLSSALLLFGMALIYARLGTMEFARIGAVLTAAADAQVDLAGDAWLAVGLALIVVGIGFKLALVPFHMWTPDIYEGAPAPVSAFVATVSKGAMFALLLRYFVSAGAYQSSQMALALGLIAIASMLAGNLLALHQGRVKRILAYSSIAHLGYLLVAFLTAGPFAAEAVAYYFCAYFVMMLGAFGVVAALSPGGDQPDCDKLADYRGLFWRRPWLAGAFTAMLLSLAGIPLTMGFVAKFYVLAAGVDASLWLLVVVLVVASAIGLFYYLRIIAAMCAPVPQASTDPAMAGATDPLMAEATDPLMAEATDPIMVKATDPVAARAPAVPRTSGLSSLTLAALTVLLVWLGIFPEPLIRLVQATVSLLG